MHVPPEIIILFFIISFLIYTMPSVLVNFSRTFNGKFVLLILTIVTTLYNKTGGMIMAMLIIFLAEFNYEFNNGIFYEGFTGTGATINEGVLNYNHDVNTLIKKPKQDLLTIEQSLMALDSSAVNTNVS
jgi:hypothetical protein